MLVGAPSSSDMVQMDCAGSQCDLNLTIPAAMIAPLAAKAMQVPACCGHRIDLAVSCDQHCSSDPVSSTKGLQCRHEHASTWSQPNLLSLSLLFVAFNKQAPAGSSGFRGRTAHGEVWEGEGCVRAVRCH